MIYISVIGTYTSVSCVTKKWTTPMFRNYVTGYEANVLIGTKTRPGSA